VSPILTRITTTPADRHDLTADAKKDATDAIINDKPANTHVCDWITRGNPYRKTSRSRDGQAAGDCRIRVLCRAGAPHFPSVKRTHPSARNTYSRSIAGAKR